MDLTQFFLLDTGWRVLALSAVLLCTGALAQALVFHRRLLPALEGKPPVAPFFTAVTALFALFVAFAAADAWARQERAAEALGREARALRTVYIIGRSQGLEAAALQASAVSYLRASLAEEWGAARNRAASGAVADALRQIEYQALAGLRRATERGEPGSVWLELLRQTQELRTARDTRLRFGRDFGQAWKWAALLLLSFASQLGIAFVQIDRRRTADVTQAIFGIAATTALGLLAGFEGPYGGIGAVEPIPLLAYQAALAAP